MTNPRITYVVTATPKPDRAIVEGYGFAGNYVVKLWNDGVWVNVSAEGAEFPGLPIHVRDFPNIVEAAEELTGTSTNKAELAERIIARLEGRISHDDMTTYWVLGARYAIAIIREECGL